MGKNVAVFHLMKYLMSSRKTCAVLTISDFADYFAVAKNPASLAKHRANPKVAPVIAKIFGPSKL